MTLVKICGLRTSRDAMIVNRAKPDLCGMICTGGFLRSVSEEQVRLLSSMIDPGIRKTGVFVDDSPDRILSYIMEGLIDVVQLHGSESEKEIGELKRRMKDDGRSVPVIKVFRIPPSPEKTEKPSETDREMENREQLSREIEACSADLVLLDSGKGSGVTFDWNRVPDLHRDYFLAGGIMPGNVRKAIRLLHPFGIDVSSGVETDGKKDENKVLELVEAVRNVNTE